MKQKAIIKISIIILSILLVVSCFAGCSLYEMFNSLIYKMDKALSCEIYMFENISELENMENSFKEENGMVQKYDPSYDECLKGLEYINQYSARYKCDNYEFEIYAYEFGTVEEAYEYYCRSKNGEEVIMETIKSSYTNAQGKVTIVALNETNVYRAKYLKNNEELIEDFLSKKLTHQITWLEEDVAAGYVFVKNDKYKT